jgi:4-hydroxy-3-methylbut-2-enyl diphosphate reductase
MCFGVRNAIRLALTQAATTPLTIFGDLVHNELVLKQLRARGVAIVNQPDGVQTDQVLITAHGASEQRKAALRLRGHLVREATCPLVAAVHRAVPRFVRAGFHPVIVGKPGHVEVRGLTEDLDECDVVLTEADVDALAERPRFGVVAQTTQPIERVRSLVARLRDRFPQAEVRFVDTVCQPTKLRQHAAVDLAQRCDVVIVIGGAGSNNTRELVETCRRFCSRVHHVQTAADLMAEWFGPDDRVGLTAGTSTPDAIIDAVEEWLGRWAGRMAAASSMGAL